MCTGPKAWYRSIQNQQGRCKEKGQGVWALRVCTHIHTHTRVHADTHMHMHTEAPFKDTLPSGSSVDDTMHMSEDEMLNSKPGFGLGRAALSSSTRPKNSSLEAVPTMASSLLQGDWEPGAGDWPLQSRVYHLWATPTEWSRLGGPE